MEHDNQGTLMQRIWRELPVVFPLIGLFHLGIFLYTVWYFASEGVLDTPTCLATCGVLLLYTALWFFSLLRNRIAATAYVILTGAMLLVLYLTRNTHTLWHEAAGSMSPFDIMSSFLLLFYYKRFR